VSSEPGATEVDAVVDAVLAVPGVHGLHAGLLGDAATYLPGRRVHGVRRDGDGWDVHLVLDWGAPVNATTAAVRTALAGLVSGPLTLTVEDVAPPAAVAP
jgi:hypothetical protein